ncbi:hypothetical protein [Reichenbachiella sp. MALMAid0571]|uniref:hypothetical protein n=1 Tax=Reichenbachiella sp. MALMAid0571 TaxID=3143939 RepID=UPI0032DE9769
MNKHTQLLILFILLTSLYSCGTGDIAKEFTKTQAVMLLSSDENKTWIRISKTENGTKQELAACEQENLLYFEVTESDSILYSVGELPGCSTSDVEPDTLLKATWSLSQNINLIATDTLFLTDENNKQLPPYIIKQLTGRKLNILFTDDNSNVIVEEYVY